MQHSLFKSFRTQKQRLKTAKGRSNASVAWLQRNLNDPYVQLTKQHGYVSRAAFKLLEIDAKFNLIKKAATIVDLGSAPGGWLQVLHRTKNKQTTLIGVDLQPISIELPGVPLVCGNFLDSQTQQIILKHSSLGINLVVSDMAVSSSGDRSLDHLRNAELVESLISFLTQHLNKNGNTAIKMIRGGQEEQSIKNAKKIFAHVKLFKPESSYSSSAEIFLIGINKL